MNNPSCLADDMETIRAIRSRNIGKQQLLALLEKEIKRELPKPPSFESICQRLHVSQRTMSRRLRAFDISYKSILTQVKLQTAMCLINEHNMSTREISTALGYNDASNFIKAFKGWTGETPTYFRSMRENRAH